MRQTLRVQGQSHRGLVHHTNEDAWAVFDTERGKVLLVCDGMGGMGRGDQASQLAVRLLAESISASSRAPEDALRDSLMEADRAVRGELCDGDDGWAGCTAVVALVHEGRAHVAWVGDSRVYLIRHGQVAGRTRDHKLVEDLIDAGEMTREEAKSSTLANVITRALGGRPPSASDLEPSAIQPAWLLHPGDMVLLCSDGLCDLVSDEEIAEVTTRNPLDAATRILVEMALARGGHDNITTVLGQYDGAATFEDDIPTQVMDPPAEDTSPNAGALTRPAAPKSPTNRTVDVPLLLTAGAGLSCVVYVLWMALL